MDQACTPANTNHQRPAPPPYRTILPLTQTHSATAAKHKRMWEDCGKCPETEWTHMHDRIFCWCKHKAENRRRCRCKVAHRHPILGQKNPNKNSTQYFLQIFIFVRLEKPLKQKFDHKKPLFNNKETDTEALLINIFLLTMNQNTTCGLTEGQTYKDLSPALELLSFLATFSSLLFVYSYMFISYFFSLSLVFPVSCSFSLIYHLV